MFCIYPVWDSIKNLWPFVILEKFQAPLLQILSLFMFSFLYFWNSHWPWELDMVWFSSSRPLKLWRPLSVGPNLCFPCRLPTKEDESVVCLPSQIPLRLGQPHNRALPQSWASGKPFGFLIKGGGYQALTVPLPLPTFGPTDGSDVWSFQRPMFSHKRRQIEDKEPRE